MKRAIATTTIPGDLGEKLHAAAGAGFDGVELFENDFLYFDRRPAEVRTLCADLGLEIVAWQPFRDLEALPARMRQRAFDRAERKFELMGELGTRLMLVCSNVSPPDLVDPRGMVVSRALTTPDGAVRLPLNTSHALHSSTQRFLARAGGAGVQHVAMACDDVFAVAERLNPHHVLPVSDNYYDDLDARWSIDGDTLARMRSLQILYDEDASGRYFQLYTRSINGLFFEIVQRDGYAGFGEPNAQARIAAQQREFEAVQRSVTLGSAPERW